MHLYHQQERSQGVYQSSQVPGVLLYKIHWPSVSQKEGRAVVTWEPQPWDSGQSLLPPRQNYLPAAALHPADRANSTISKPAGECIYTYCHFQVRLHLLPLLQKKGKKVNTIKTQEPDLAGEASTFSYRSYQTKMGAITSQTATTRQWLDTMYGTGFNLHCISSHS